MAETLKEDVKRYLADVPDGYVFRCCDGSVFRNMKELRDGLANMSEETYAYHANAEKNDFSRWVREVIGDEKLAVGLQSSTSRIDAAKQVGTRVTTIKRKRVSG